MSITLFDGRLFGHFSHLSINRSFSSCSPFLSISLDIKTTTLRILHPWEGHNQGDNHWHKTTNKWHCNFCSLWMTSIVSCTWFFFTIVSLFLNYSSMCSSRRERLQFVFRLENYEKERCSSWRLLQHSSSLYTFSVFWRHYEYVSVVKETWISLFPRLLFVNALTWKCVESLSLWKTSVSCLSS